MTEAELQWMGFWISLGSFVFSLFFLAFAIVWHWWHS